MALRPHRRDLLRSLCATAALPAVAAASAAPPRRILFYVSSHGTVYDRWRIRAGQPDDVDYSLDLPALLPTDASPILEPLWDVRDQLVVLDGVGNAAAVVSGIFAHSAGSASCQTGRIPRENPGGPDEVDGPSVDQLIAAGQPTPFPSLEWDVGMGSPVAYDPLGRALPVESDPVAVFKRLFPTAPETDHPEETAVIGARQRQVLELTAGRCEATVPRLPEPERDRMRQHCALVRDLADRMDRLAALQCAAPPEPAATPDPEAAGWAGHQVDAFLDLAVAAFACDVTRVVSLRVDKLPTATVGAPPGDLHFDYAHSVRSGTALDYMTVYHRFHAARIRRLIDALAATPDGGGTLLDRTVVVWHNELATGNHLLHTVPVVLAGSSDVLNSGTYHRFAPAHAFAGRLYPEVIGRPYNQLLTTLAVAMGLPLDRVGEAELPLADGSRLDVTGTLPGVLRW